MRIFIFASAIVMAACVLHITHAGETKRKKLVLVVPEKVRHIHHHHVKKIYIKSKPHYSTSYEEQLHREDSAGSFEDDDVGAIKIKSRHHKRHSGSRQHKEESKKVVVYSEEVPDSSDWHGDKSTEVHHTHSDHASAASIISKLTSQPTKSSSDSSSEEEHRTIVFLDNEGSITESPRGHVKTIHQHRGRDTATLPNPNTEPQTVELRPQSNEPRPQNIINHSPERQHPVPNRLLNHDLNRPHIHINHGGKPLQRGKPFHGPNDVEKKPSRNSTFIENLVPPPVKQPSFTRVVHGSTGFSHGQPGAHSPNQNHPPGRSPTPPTKTITGPVPQNTPNRAASSGYHGVKSSFFHNHNQPLNL